MNNRDVQPTPIFNVSQGYVCEVSDNNVTYPYADYLDGAVAAGS